MATRSLMALDYSNYHTNSVLKKHARNRPLGAIEHKHNYVPAQPVLSCRTVNIDLLGTRTYRPKSTVDILEEQQRLIRSLRSRVAASAPPRPVTEPTPRPSSDDGFKRVNIEVKGRPFTSPSQASFPSESKPETRTRRRPKTTGRLKNVQPATDSFMVIKVDQDLLASSQNNRELTSKLHAYWRSDPQSLATGRFVRGQKRPDDVPPTLDAWLTFGGAAEDDSQGVIDAFATFKSSEEYYNIEGSVGSRVAQQLQKGDKIRIGINGVVQSHDFKIKKWSKDSSVISPQDLERNQQTDSVEEQGAVGETEEEQLEAGEVAHTEEDTREGKEVEARAEIAGVDSQNGTDGDFKELVIGDLDDLLEDSTDTNKLASSPAPTSQPTMQHQTSKSEKPASPVIVPLSWDDQCTKSDVKVIQPTVSPREQARPVMSETYPVRFEKLIGDGSRPRLAQAKRDGYKIKQRPQSKISNRPGTSSKVKVVYIDPLTADDEARVGNLSVEEIVNVKVVEGGMRGPPHLQNIHRSYSREGHHNSSMRNSNSGNNIITINDDPGSPVPGQKAKRVSSGKACTNGGGEGGGGGRVNQRSAGSRPNSHHSVSSAGDHSRVASPKLKTLPVHPSVSMQQQATLSITANNARRVVGSDDVAPATTVSTANHSHKAVKTGIPGRSSPAKPMRVGSGHGGGGPRPAVSAPHHQGGEAEYIKITTQLKTGGVPPSLYADGGGISHPHHPQQQTPYLYSPGSNTPRDLDYQEATPGDYYNIGDEPSPHTQPTDVPATTATKPSPNRGSNNNVSQARVGSGKGDMNKTADTADTRASSPLSESPPPTNVAISIPTADELSDREESPSRSPDRGAGRSPDLTALTPMERRERDLRNEQIDQITHLIGGAIVESG